MAFYRAHLPSRNIRRTRWRFLWIVQQCVRSRARNQPAVIQEFRSAKISRAICSRAFRRREQARSYRSKQNQFESTDAIARAITSANCSSRRPYYKARRAALRDSVAHRAQRRWLEKYQADTLRHRHFFLRHFQFLASEILRSKKLGCAPTATPMLHGRRNGGVHRIRIARVKPVAILAEVMNSNSRIASRSFAEIGIEIDLQVHVVCKLRPMRKFPIVARGRQKRVRLSKRHFGKTDLIAGAKLCCNRKSIVITCAILG